MDDTRGDGSCRRDTRRFVRVFVMREPDWQSDDGAIQLYCADSLELLPEMEPGSVDCVVTDLPYGIAVGSAFVRGNCCEIVNGSGPFNEGHSWAWLDNPTWLISGGNVAAFHARGDSLPSHLITWHRYYLIKRAPPPTPRPVFVSAVEECTVGRNGGKIRWFGSGYVPNYWLGMTPNRLCCGSGHPAQKPLEPIETLCGALSGGGETILDPFLGSGTTAVACVKLGRKCIGIEIEPKYFEIAVKRVKAALVQGPDDALFRQADKQCGQLDMQYAG